MMRMQRISLPGSDTDALQLDARFAGPGSAIAGCFTSSYLCYPRPPRRNLARRRVIRGQVSYQSG